MKTNNITPVKDVTTCPKCRGEEAWINGIRRRVNYPPAQGYKCKKCGYQFVLVPQRAIPRIGEGHGMAKITNKEVKNIFELRESGETLKNIGKKFGLSESQISRIISGKSRKK